MGRKAAGSFCKGQLAALNGLLEKTKKALRGRTLLGLKDHYSSAVMKRYWASHRPR